jgi:hypothetical protein
MSLMNLTFFVIFIIIIVLLHQYHQRVESFNQKIQTLPITLLVRSYHRPEYLRHSIASLQESDIHLCQNRLVYDDGSRDPETLGILKNLHHSTKKNGFQVYFQDKNVGCRQSYVDALETIQKLPDFNPSGYTCIIDNDVQVNKKLIEQLFFVYKDAVHQLKTKNIVLSGFNPSNAHRNSVVKTFRHFHIKKTVGGVCYFFSNHLIDTIKQAWSQKQDWGVNYVFDTRPDHHMICVNQSLVNHIGQWGLHSSESRYDSDDEFSQDSIIDDKSKLF